MKEISASVFQASDGRLFLTSKECEDYEKEVLGRIAKLQYFHIVFGPDTTEGRGYTNCHVLAIEHEHPMAAAIQWCIRFCGPVLQYVQGVQVMEGWHITHRPDDGPDLWRRARYGKEDWERVYVQCGDYKHYAGATFLTDDPTPLPGYPHMVSIKDMPGDLKVR